MNGKSILVLYAGDDFGRKQPAHRAGLRNMYNHWQAIAKARGYDLLRASIQWFEDDHFFQYWRHVGNSTWEKVTGVKYLPSSIYDQAAYLDRKTGHFLPNVYPIKLKISKIVPLLNQPEFTILVDNKLNQSVIFSKFMPKTTLYLKGDVARNPQKQIMVLKRLHGSGGKTVDITRASRFRFIRPTIEQEFIAAKQNGQLKDLRIVFNGDDARYAYHRIAKSRSLFTNVHQGAKTLWVELDDIPEVIDLARKIMRPLRVFPKKVYSLDFLVDSQTNKPFLIEANTAPGFSVFRTATNKTPAEREKLINNYLNYLTDYLFS